MECQVPRVSALASNNLAMPSCGLPGMPGPERRGWRVFAGIGSFLIQTHLVRIVVPRAFLHL